MVNYETENNCVTIASVQVREATNVFIIITFLYNVFMSYDTATCCINLYNC